MARNGAIPFSPRSPEFVADPYPVYAMLRRESPVHRGPMGVWVLTRYDDVEAALADTRLGNAAAPHAIIHARNRERYIAADVANTILPFLDAPRHAGPRKLIARAFNGYLKRNKPKFDAIADRLLAPHLAAGEIELMGDFARPLSAAVICEVLGIPETDSGLLAEWSEFFFYLWHAIPSKEVLSQIEKALAEFRQYMARALDERAEAPRDDLISALIQVEENGQGLSRAEVIDTCMLIFADGVENVDSGIGNAVVDLLDHPEQLELLRQQPELMDGAVEECLRFDPAGQFIGRVVREDVCIRSQPIRKNQVIQLVLASANRDPARFEDPDRLDITRSENPHLTFGKGRHSCVGARLVRMEMAVALARILESLPGLTRRDPSWRWQARMGHRWLESLPVRFTPQ